MRGVGFIHAVLAAVLIGICAAAAAEAWVETVPPAQRCLSVKQMERFAETVGRPIAYVGETRAVFFAAERTVVWERVAGGWCIVPDVPA